MSEQEPALLEQTAAIGKLLQASMESDPSGTPSDTAALVFAEWLAVAGPASKQPLYFADVADNYVVRDNSNRDLLDLFMMLSGYLEEALAPDIEPESFKTFIGLPLAE